MYGKYCLERFLCHSRQFVLSLPRWCCLCLSPCCSCTTLLFIRVYAKLLILCKTERTSSFSRRYKATCNVLLHRPSEVLAGQLSITRRGAERNMEREREIKAIAADVPYRSSRKLGIVVPFGVSFEFPKIDRIYVCFEGTSSNGLYVSRMSSHCAVC